MTASVRSSRLGPGAGKRGLHEVAEPYLIGGRQCGESLGGFEYLRDQFPSHAGALGRHDQYLHSAILTIRTAHDQLRLFQPVHGVHNGRRVAVQTSRQILLGKRLIRIELDKRPGCDRRQAGSVCGLFHACLPSCGRSRDDRCPQIMST